MPWKQFVRAGSSSAGRYKQPDHLLPIQGMNSVCPRNIYGCWNELHPHPMQLAAAFPRIRATLACLALRSQSLGCGPTNHSPERIAFAASTRSATTSTLRTCPHAPAFW